MITSEVKSLIRARFCSPEWATFFEVGDGTGGNQRRWADVVAMNMWSSRGLEIHGFEIKVSRGDWLRELKKPEKSGPVQQYCDRWWIVAPKEIIKHDELPPTWGYFDVTPSGLRQIIAAPKLDAIPVTKSFMAAMLRRAGGVDEAEVSAAVEREAKKLRVNFEERVQHEVDMRSRRSNEALEKLAEFEKETGLSLSGYGAIKEIADAVRFVQASGVINTYRGISSMANDAERFAKRVREFLSKSKDEAA